jgi:hypothetical protein
MGMTLSACCSGSGVCGFDLSMVGLGCDSLSAFGSFLMMDTGAPQACGDASGVTGDAEAGPGGDAAGE